MKSVYACLVVFCATIALAGCGGPEKENTLATDGASVDAFAQYEADLAAANAEGTYEDEGDEAEGQDAE